MDVLKIILSGIAATVVAAYITSSMLLAQKQLVAATRLSGYLTYWQNWILEHELFGVYHLGMKWNEEAREIRKRGGGAADLVKLQQEKKKLLTEVKEKIEEGIVLNQEGLILEMQRFPKESVGNVLESSKTTKQNLIDGKTFISDEEAAALGVAFTHTCIELKMGLLDLVDGGTMLAVTLMSAPPDFDIKNYSADISQAIWKGILVSKNIDLISGAARAISSKSVVALTLQNIVSGKRLTKR